jgi:hypothetical protein
MRWPAPLEPGRLTVAPQPSLPIERQQLPHPHVMLQFVVDRFGQGHMVMVSAAVPA